MLAGHQVETVYERGWAELTNGVLLQMAEDAGFDVMITTHQGIRYQQNLSGRKLTLVVISTNDWTRIRKSKSVVVNAISEMLPGSLVEVRFHFANLATDQKRTRREAQGFSSIAIVNEICHPPNVQYFRASSRLILTLVAITRHCWACTYFYNPVTVGPNFVVSIEVRGRPVEGLRPDITGNHAVTDKNGYASFRGVAPGSYLLSAALDDGVAADVALDVKPDGPADLVVPMKWPHVATVVVRSLKGTIRGPDYLPGTPQPRLSIDLLDAISGKLLKSLQTTDGGEFSFESDAPGIYFLRLNPSGLRGWSGEEFTGLIAVAVDHFPPADHLDLDLGWTSCGLWYSDVSNCPQGDLHIGELSGRVLDTSGAAIAGASIILFDPAGKLVERLQSDRTGTFASNHPLAGTYQLVVSQTGFTPLRKTVHKEPTGDSKLLPPLTVKLGVFGYCSSADHP